MEALSHTELFAAVLANQLLILAALRRMVGNDLAVVIDKQIGLTNLLLSTKKVDDDNAPDV